MKVARCCRLALVSALALPCGLMAGQSAYGDLTVTAGLEKSASIPYASPPAQLQNEAVQYLPPSNNEPGFDWTYQGKELQRAQYLRVGAYSTYFKTSEAYSGQLADSSGKCLLTANTLYSLRTAPVFQAQHIIAELETPLPGCAFTRGFIYMPHVSSTSAGGLWELPVNVRAFLDTLAFSEGTKEHYNYIFTFVAFSSYADHPRKKVCLDGLCSTAAGRYQFLAKTWDPLAKELALPDFTPPNQEKAALELIRRSGAYKLVAGSAKYANFSKAITKLNPIWASLPGSPYGQPTHTMKRLWEVYTAALAGYQ